MLDLSFDSKIFEEGILKDLLVGALSSPRLLVSTEDVVM